jgi:hypothetical protein
VSLYLTYGSTCVAVLIAHFRGSIPEGAPGYFSPGRWLLPVTVTCVAFSITVIVFMVGPSSSHIVLLYTIGFEALGTIWYLAAVRGRLRRGEAGPGAGLAEEAAKGTAVAGA